MEMKSGKKSIPQLEKLLLKFCKELLASSNATSIAVYGETGTFPFW